MSYKPSPAIIDKYADVLVNFALNDGKGVKPGEVVRISAQESQKPLLLAVDRAVIKAGAHSMLSYIPDEVGEQRLYRDFLELASDEQLDFFPEKFFRGLADQIDHIITLIGEADPHVMKGVDSKKMMRYQQSRKPFRDWLEKKENAGKFTWTVALYGTEAKAKEAGLTLEEYWQEIINACYLDEADPVAKWKEVLAQVEDYKTRFNALSIDKLHIEGEDADLWITLGEKRKWDGGGGRNVPSFEIFTSPDWRGTEGWIRFNQPLYAFGNMVEGIELKFEKGEVTSATATKNEEFLKEMIATEGANRIGEFSLTDARLSKINKFMADTLYDENMGGKYGNTHIALGMSYQTCYDGDPTTVSKQQWKEIGFNDSTVHEDLISTSDRTVTAIMKDGSEQVIYKDGQYQF